MPVEKMVSGLLTNAETAALLSMHPQQLRNWRYKRKGPAYFKIHGRCYYTRGTVKRWLMERMVDPEV